jgi:formimidoylglutamate deiminase
MNTGTQESALREGERRAVKTFQFKALLQSAGWISPAFVQVDDRGIIQSISDISPDPGGPVEFVNGFAVPGFHNAHSHAFQFAMAGAAERHEANAVDDFWTWREAMYTCALTLDPDELLAVAAMLYTELLKRGYTHVAEFQYLHHDKNGKPYDHRAEMSVSLVAAAAIAGIKITLVPVFYQKGGFGKDATPAQRRFCFASVDEYLALLEDSTRIVKDLTTANVGFGVHSLRAADTEDILRIVAQGPEKLPFHMHAAEQLKEVNECVAFLNKRPVEWLLDNVELDHRFHLVHCTHLTDDEVVRLARSQAHVVLCPGTEANLGDGIFRLTDFARESNHWSIGTDSHISLNPLEDLRWLDYTQRLTQHKRNTFADGAAVLMKNTYFSGKSAMGLSSGDYFEAGQALDAVIYNGDSPLLNAAQSEHLLPALVYTADGSSVIGTIVDGEWIARDLRHRNETDIVSDFQRAMKGISDRG